MVAPEVEKLLDSARRQRRSGRALLWVAAGWFGVAFTLFCVSMTPEKPSGNWITDQQLLRYASIGAMVSALGWVIPGGVLFSKGGESARRAEQLIRDAALRP